MNPSSTQRPLKFFEKLILTIISLFVKTLYKTLRVNVDKNTSEALKNNSSSALFCWHGGISMLPYVNYYLRNGNPIVGLMSSSKDGSYLSYFFTKFGVDSERGSSSKNGGRAAINLIRILRGGGHICITPDGPRGPIHKAKSGMLEISRKSNDSRMIFLRIEFTNTWKFKSWDKFCIPKPFSKIKIMSSEFHTYNEFLSYANSKNVEPIDLCEHLLNNPL